VNKVRSAALVGAIAVAAGGGYWAAQLGGTSSGVAIVTPTPPVAATAAATPTEALILVHVAGAVHAPGVYALAADARVIDAVEAAGGLADEAAVDQINLADHLQDAMRLYIPARGERTPAPPTPITSTRSGTLGAGSGGLININTASQAELEALPHVGAAIAQRIIDYRKTNGPFQRIEDLRQVQGIGDKIYVDLQPLVTVD